MTIKRRVALGLVVTAAFAGVAEVLAPEGSSTAAALVDIGVLVAFITLLFVWVHFDSLEIGFRRSPLLNAGVLALPLIFFPVYLARSRPEGSRVQALLGCLAFFVLLLFVAAVFAFGAFLLAT